MSLSDIGAMWSIGILLLGGGVTVACLCSPSEVSRWYCSRLSKVLSLIMVWALGASMAIPGAAFVYYAVKLFLLRGAC